MTHCILICCGVNALYSNVLSEVEELVTYMVHYMVHYNYRILHSSAEKGHNVLKDSGRFKSIYNLSY